MTATDFGYKVLHYSENRARRCYVKQKQIISFTVCFFFFRHNLPAKKYKSYVDDYFYCVTHFTHQKVLCRVVNFALLWLWPLIFCSGPLTFCTERERQLIKHLHSRFTVWGGDATRFLSFLFYVNSSWNSGNISFKWSNCKKMVWTQE